MANNQRHQWRHGNPPSYNYPNYSNGTADAPSLPTQPLLPPLSYLPIQPGPAPSSERQALPPLHPPFSSHVLPSIQPSLAQERQLRPSIHQPILSQNTLPSQRIPPEVSEIISPQARSPTGSPASNISGYRPLNVRDALAYLEKVKNEFHSQPEIYNRFLDIMKDFKTQTINTPGVIARVSNLFRGFPSLVFGFNTFLPPGYRIERSTDPNDTNGFRVILPDSETSIATTRGEQYGPSNSVSNIDYRHPGSYEYNSARASQPPLFNYPPSNNYSVNRENSISNHPPPMVDSLATQRTPMEFNHAINFVNRIKNRFSRDPESYKQFLDILQMYQKESKPIQEIYAQVHELFGTDQDLLNEFTQFLPESRTGNLDPPSQNHLPSNSFVPLPPHSNIIPPSNSVKGFSSTTINHGPLKINGGILNSNNELPIPIQKENSISSIIDPPLPRLPYSTPIKIEHGSSIPGNILASPSQSTKLKKSRSLYSTDKAIPPIKSKKSKINAKTKDATDLSLADQQLAFESQYHNQAMNLASEVDFKSFERIRSFLNHQPTFHEFLKVINLYAQEVIDYDTLLGTASNFIGEEPVLLSWFKEYIGYPIKPEETPAFDAPSPKLDLTQFRAFGPSYRQLPKSESKIKCSGRDELCHEVLNDDFASHPTWASEDTVFVAHKKNAFEEALHKSEEDRFELDYNMETNSHTIALLEPINKALLDMPPEQAASYKLPPGLNGASLTIYKRAIRKVYDTDASEVLDLLHEIPATSVPIVLKRLKQKDQEWREIKKEWSKIWREIDLKNFYRSLDYQTTQFKYNDRKNITVRNLVSEIEALKKDQVEQLSITDNRNLIQTGRYCMSFELPDVSLHKDMARLILCALGSHCGFSLGERKKIVVFMKSFIHDFFGAEFMDGFDTGTMDDDNGDSELGSSCESDLEVAAPSNSKKNMKLPNINKQQDTSSIESKAFKSDKSTQFKPNNGSPHIKIENTELKIPSDSSNNNLKESSLTSWHDLNVNPAAKFTGFFNHPSQVFMICNTHIYAFIRLYYLLYSRLKDIKANGISANLKFKVLSATKTASKVLDLQPKFEALNGIDFSSADCYGEFLNLTERVLEADIEQHAYEDSLRFIFGNNIFNIFTIDKILGSLCKQANLILLDQNKNTFEITQHFQTLRQNHPNLTLSNVADYYSSIQPLFDNDENLYTIEYSFYHRKLAFQVLSSDELTSEYFLNLKKRWETYVSNLTSSISIPSVTLAQQPLLSRLIRRNKYNDVKRTVTFHHNLKVDICSRSLKLRWPREISQESMICKSKKPDLITSQDTRKRKWESILQGPSGWTRNLKDPKKSKIRCLHWLQGKGNGSLLRPIAKDTIPNGADKDVGLI